MTWVKEPFKTVVIEVIDPEKKDHAQNKNYPEEFKVITVGVNESLKGLL